MAHIPYADLADPAVRPLVDRIVAERGSVLHLYQMLLHSAPLAEGWLGFMTAVRQKLALPGALRELVIMRVAQLNGAPYEAQQHHPIALKEGVTAEQLQALANWRESSAFDDLERAVLDLCDTMTRQIQVPQAVLLAVRQRLGNQQTVELAATVASYNMVSRFLEALQIHGTDERQTQV
jgi:AhpD family alkylhydroperoxidase